MQSTNKTDCITYWEDDERCITFLKYDKANKQSDDFDLLQEIKGYYRDTDPFNIYGITSFKTKNTIAKDDTCIDLEISLDTISDNIYDSTNSVEYNEHQDSTTVELLIDEQNVEIIDNII